MNQSLKYVLLICVFLSACAEQKTFSDAQIASRKKDYAEAATIYKTLAAQGNALAQLLLGIKYYDGQGVPHDLVRAYMWTNLAAENADNEKQIIYTKIRELVAKQMTANQVAEAQELAGKCTANKFKEC